MNENFNNKLIETVLVLLVSKKRFNQTDLYRKGKTGGMLQGSGIRLSFSEKSEWELAPV